MLKYVLRFLHHCTILWNLIQAYAYALGLASLCAGILGTLGMAGFLWYGVGNNGENGLPGTERAGT